MKSLIFSIACLVSHSIYANIQPGTWSGRVSDQARCFMDVGAQTFENNIKNPLNERIEITMGSTTYSVRHPYSINTQDGTVTVNLNLLEAVAPTKTGAYALQIVVEHTSDFDMPVSLSVMEDDWQANNREVMNCFDLKLHN